MKLYIKDGLNYEEEYERLKLIAYPPGKRTNIKAMNLLFEFEHNKYPLTIECECGSRTFRIIYTDSYETSGQCTECNKIHVVHTG